MIFASILDGSIPWYHEWVSRVSNDYEINAVSITASLKFHFSFHHSLEVSLKILWLMQINSYSTLITILVTIIFSHTKQNTFVSCRFYISIMITDHNCSLNHVCVLKIWQKVLTFIDEVGFRQLKPLWLCWYRINVNFVSESPRPLPELMLINISNDFVIAKISAMLCH